MAETVTMPKLGFDMAEGTLVRWVITEGQPVAKGAVLAEIETDKATVEVESVFDGVVLKHLVAEGDIVPVNTPIAVVGQAGEMIASPSSPAESTKSKEKASIPGEENAEIATIQTMVAPIGNGKLPGGKRASPLARRLAQEYNLDLDLINGSGPQGRITRKDVEAYLAKPATGITLAPAKQSVTTSPGPLSIPAVTPPTAELRSSTPPLVSLEPPQPDQIIPLNRLRGAIGRRMVEAKQAVPHFYVSHEYDMAPVLEMRKQINALLPEDQKLSVNDFILRAVALNLRQYPNLNASLEENAIRRHGQVNIGVAVAVEGGLLTVVCRNTDRKSLRQIAMEVRSMAARAREGKVRPEDIEGSTFSVSNLGMFEVENFVAIINPPEAAILAVGSARETAVIKNGQVQPGIRMKVTLSVDHRVSDGAEAARFLQDLALYLHEPLRTLI
jgi:pyruvate dehydrogenase E2 component (dihydrolipoamide acetyltransferase)